MMLLYKTGVGQHYCVTVYSYSYSILITFDLVSFVSCVSFVLFGSSVLQSYFNFRGSSQYQLVFSDLLHEVRGP